MAELKTKPTAVSVHDFLSAVADEQKRADAFTLLEMMTDITGETPKMWGPSIVGFGQYHYVYDSGHEGDCCLTGFSPRKDALTLYLYAGLEQRFAAELKALGKVKTGKGCLYIKKLADVDLNVLRGMIRASIAQLKKLSKPKAKEEKAKPARKSRKKT
ncbi:MAG: DUF1801 domain-containing protein [Gemmataceae bacterium]